MKMRIFLGVVAVAFFMLTALATDVFANGSPINGTWVGPVKRGGELHMTLKVVGNQIEGTGHIKFGGKTIAHAAIFGTTDGSKVHLEVQYAKVPNIVRYWLELEDDNKLVGRQGKDFEVTFAKQ